MLIFEEKRKILRYRDYNLSELLEENLKPDFPITVKVASYVSSSDTSFLSGLGDRITSELNSEPPFFRKFFVENIVENAFPEISLKEMLLLIYFFSFTKDSIKRATTCVILETQYEPYSFLSEIINYDISWVISKIKSDMKCAKFKEHLFSTAKKNNKLDLFFACPFFYLDGYELQSFGVPESYVVSYLENLKEPRSETDRLAFDSIFKRLQLER